MKEIHCKNCGRFLLKLSFGSIEIKCPNSKCKNVNHVKMVSNKHLLQLTVEQEISIIKA